MITLTILLGLALLIGLGLLIACIVTGGILLLPLLIDLFITILIITSIVKRHKRRDK